MKRYNYKVYLVALDLLRNSVLSVRSYVLDKNLYKLDLSRINVELANIICVSSLFNSKKENVL